MKKPDWKIWIKDNKECKFWLDIYIKKGVLRRSINESRLYLRKTEHNLNFANWIFEKNNKKFEIFNEENYYDWITNIYYYAIYHSALALLSKKRYQSKSHSATLCFLIYFYCHKNKELDFDDVELVASSLSQEELSKEDIEIIGASKELREKACYDVSFL
jgi:uncharacterized protein (UPF0332 family)